MVRFNLPFIGIVGNNSARNQIRFGQLQKYGRERGDVGNKLGDVASTNSPRCWAVTAKRCAIPTRSTRLERARVRASHR